MYKIHIFTMVNIYIFTVLRPGCVHSHTVNQDPPLEQLLQAFRSSLSPLLWPRSPDWFTEQRFWFEAGIYLCRLIINSSLRNTATGTDCLSLSKCRMLWGRAAAISELHNRSKRTFNRLVFKLLLQGSLDVFIMLVSAGNKPVHPDQTVSSTIIINVSKFTWRFLLVTVLLVSHPFFFSDCNWLMPWKFFS